MRSLLFILAVTLSSWGYAKTDWLGIFLQGQKIGYSSSTQTDLSNGYRRDVVTEIKSELMGSALQISIRSSSWFDPKGNLTRMQFKSSSLGRDLQVTAEVKDKVIEAVMLAGENKSSKSIPIPKGALVTDDPMLDLAQLSMVGLKRTYFVFAPDSMQLLEVKVENLGQESILLNGKSVSAYKVLIQDPRAKTTAFFSGKGDFLTAQGPMGMETRAMHKEQALADSSGKVQIADLAYATAIVPEGNVSRTASVLTLLFTKGDLSHVPSEGYQKVTKTDEGYLVSIGTIPAPNQATTILEAQKGKEKWLGPDVRVPADDPEFIKLAASIIKDEKRVIPAAQLLRKYVHQSMDVNLGIGVLRDAREIIKSKEGVCRDHAILFGTLTRAAGIPTRFANGIVWAGSEFMYHAWIEVWDGEKWVGLDSTVPADTLTVTHIKTAQGSVGEAQTGFLLDGATVKVIKEKD